MKTIAGLILFFAGVIVTPFMSLALAFMFHARNSAAWNGNAFAVYLLLWFAGIGCFIAARALLIAGEKDRR